VFPEEGVEGGAEAAAARISADISPLFALDRSRPSDARLAALSEALSPFHVVRMDTRGLSWVPIPGLAAFAEGRPAAGGAALAGAVVGTAAWVSVLGKTTPTVAEHAGLGAVGAVVISLVANQIAAAPGGANAASAVIAPLQGGAAMVIGARF
jgi:hypothetical protein